ncbi:MAG TPA: 50S ribosomal protein L9 [Nitrospiraceae bacterium]|nr:50S ribosomal protein L9 [Nitrospiraceae bacterium]
MKVILQENVDGVGHLGDLLDVSDGYARNYLFPRGKALEANPRNVKALEHAKRVTAEKAKKEKMEVEDYAKKVSAVSLTMTVQAGKDDKLFGSVTAKDIAEALAEKGFTVDRRKIQLGQPIKELGTFAIPIKLHHEVTASVSITVIKKKEDTDTPVPRDEETATNGDQRTEE